MFGSAGQNRTVVLRVMSPMSYHFSTAQTVVNSLDDFTKLVAEAGIEPATLGA